MRLLEYEAKSILAAASIAVPIGTVVRSNEDLSHITLPSVVKSQVPVGGRGKAGGIQIVRERRDLERAVNDIFTLEIKQHLPKTILCEELLDIDRELYVSLVIDRASSTIECLAHHTGGIEIESQPEHEFFRCEIDTQGAARVGESLADFLDIPEQSFALQDMIEKLYSCFVRNDATLIEINPLILTKTGSLVAGDCKMTLDDAAAFRHPEWDFQEKPTTGNFVILNPQGTVATIANGAGLAMATVDAVHAADLVPANFLDIGGGATVESITQSFRTILDFPSVTAIIINIFGGIVRCDNVANAIVAARREFSHLPPLYIRLSGTNSEIAAKILLKEGLVLHPTLSSCISEARRG